MSDDKTVEVNDQLGVVLPDSTAEAEVEMVPLFTLDGQTYEIAKKYPASLSVGYLRQVKESGPEVGWAWLMEEVLGEDAMEALETHPSITDEHMDQIGQIIRHHALGATKGKGPRRVTGRKRPGGGKPKARKSAGGGRQ
ncbi:hypothetical protein ACWFMI_23525 [Nocardiopsis terrae]|uniref:hypothetical protein n=1 Tax=Streptomyces sp. NPDC057554 TaxID=3350538 RepID=UPI0036CDFC4C